MFEHTHKKSYVVSSVEHKIHQHTANTAMDADQIMHSIRIQSTYNCFKISNN